LLTDATLGKKALSTALGQRAISGQLNAALRQLLRSGLVELTLPDKPNSRLQQYRLTEAGKTLLASTGKPRKPRMP